MSSNAPAPPQQQAVQPPPPPPPPDSDAVGSLFSQFTANPYFNAVGALFLAPTSRRPDDRRSGLRSSSSRQCCTFGAARPQTRRPPVPSPHAGRA
ncbi:uncharacterized protein K452DRAFT_75245 [Aplosporella prunicola CBS 121167]|uniref:Uncharacterized protein n=1 Tax=Aplosporella prunicola CBS 121167 TaxID=1176127 RepID=A0A6A6B5M3_9PEZI|nr:uncharacterized protein K452DRAFT_75245 [Aplosporella prunicola CBS 121167]KAF2139320.1 hypothetical protein K452DRAFT_75245 [Aplosporella prunicola CBS 121167]